jgi:hypothetical protein
MMEVLAVLVAELARARGEMAQIVHGRDERPTDGRIPFRRAGHDRLGDTRDQATELRQRRNGELRDRIPRARCGRHQVAGRRTIADVVENDGAEQIQFSYRFVCSHWGDRL